MLAWVDNCTLSFAIDAAFPEPRERKRMNDSITPSIGLGVPALLPCLPQS